MEEGRPVCCRRQVPKLANINSDLLGRLALIRRVIASLLLWDLRMPVPEPSVRTVNGRRIASPVVDADVASGDVPHPEVVLYTWHPP